MKQVWLMFIMEGGMLAKFGMPQAEAENLIRQWASGQLRLKDQTKLTGVCSLTGASWALLIDSIVGLHTISLEASQQQQGQNPWGGIGSGRN